MKNERIIEFAKYNLDHSFRLIQHVENKANILLATASVTLSIFLGNLKSLIENELSTIISIAVLTLLVTTILLIIRTIRAKIKFKEPENMIYFLYVKNMDRQHYINQFKDLSENDLINHLLNETYTLAHIQNLKYKRLNLSITFFIITYSLVIFLIAYEIIKINVA